MSRILKTSDEIGNSYIDERVAFLLPQFEALAPYKLTQRKKGVGDIPGWERLAAVEAKNLKINYPDDRPEDEKEYGTALRQITALKKNLVLAAKTGLKDSALYNPVCTIITNFGNALSYQFASYKEKQNATYREKVTERRQPENRIEIDLTQSLTFANTILTNIKNGENENWMDVSCAIALATGRRMGEVHLSAIFKKVDDYTIEFKGHLKGKSRKVRVGEKSLPVRDVAFNIPTLVNANLVCFGLQWLNDKGKRFEPTEDPERVNRRFSKTLNEHCKQFNIFPEDERTYHKFRAAYFRASIINAGVDSFDFIDYAEQILIDKDESTINSYKRYEIKKDTLTKI
ncbi:protelomerase family protein [Nostoc sp.]